jgi:hypothetical protein
LRKGEGKKTWEKACLLNSGHLGKDGQTYSALFYRETNEQTTLGEEKKELFKECKVSPQYTNASIALKQRIIHLTRKKKTGIKRILSIIKHQVLYRARKNATKQNMSQNDYLLVKTPSYSASKKKTEPAVIVLSRLDFWFKSEVVCG